MMAAWTLAAALAVGPVPSSPVASSWECDLEAQDIRRDYGPGEQGGSRGSGGQRLSRAETLCLQDPDRAMDDLRDLRRDLQLESLQAEIRRPNIGDPELDSRFRDRSGLDRAR